MRGWVLDLVHSLRLFRKAPGFAFLAVLCLALGIGANTAIFSLLNALFLRPLPVEQADRVVVLSRGATPLFSHPEYRDLESRASSLAGLAVSNPTESSLEVDGITHLAAAEAVSANYPQVIGVRTYLGRWFDTDDELSAVLSYDAWQRYFHGDAGVLGKSIRSETQRYTIVGVAPKEFEGIYLPLNTALWVPLRAWVRQYGELQARLEDRSRPFLFIFGRLKAGGTTAQAASDLNGVAGQLWIAAPGAMRESARAISSHIAVERVRGVPNIVSRRAAGPIAAVLMAVVGVVLLIACVNAGNLILAHGAARGREISVRIALGAQRKRVLRQLLTECALLAAAAGGLGLLLGVWTNRLLETVFVAGPVESLHLNLALDARVIGFTAALSLVTILFFGLAPARRASRTDVVAALKGDSPRLRLNLRRVATVGQVALSLVLLLVAGLFLRVLGRFAGANPGFAVDNRLYVTVNASPPEFTSATARQYYAEALQRLRALPGVRSAAMTNLLPLTPMTPSCVSSGTDSEETAATNSAIDAGYLAAMRIALVAGRNFNSGDAQDSPPVAIVDQALAKRLWPGESPLGKRFVPNCRTSTEGLEVIGVASDVKFASLGAAPQPHFYRPVSQVYGGVQRILVETAAEPGGMIEAVRRTVTSLNVGARVYDVSPLSEWVDRSYWQIRFEARLMAAFAGLALLLAAAGLYGVIAYHVSSRTREIGIRMALGARPADVVGLVLRQGLRSTAAGIGIGLALSALVSRALTSLLYGANPTDPETYAAVSLLWAVVALAACYVPARRAGRIDPAVTLRSE